MCKKRETLRLKLDDYTRICLTAIAILLTVLIVGLWANDVPAAREAQAVTQGPFLGTGTQVQLVELVKAQDKTTTKVEAILQLLQSGQLKVQIVDAKDKDKGAPNAPPKTEK